MQLYFIRHGQSENNALWDRAGPREERCPDPELTDLGHEQARRLARFLAKLGTNGSPPADEPANEADDGLASPAPGAHLIWVAPVLRISRAAFCTSATPSAVYAQRKMAALSGIPVKPGEKRVELESKSKCPLVWLRKGPEG